RSQWRFDLTQIPVGVGAPIVPTGLALLGPWPNPSRGEVRFAIELATEGRVSAVIYDALGRRVANLLDRPVTGTRAAVTWSGRDDDGRAVRAGTYYLRVSQRDGASLTRRVVRLD
ncbi:MAG: T9SS type A sorting domain-containing protein, partial [Candidatus Eisenbacteria bacterium]